VSHWRPASVCESLDWIKKPRGVYCVSLLYDVHTRTEWPPSQNQSLDTQLRAGDSSVVELLSSMCKALGSIPTTTNTKTKQDTLDYNQVSSVISWWL
jgi:hypothetical protein